MSEWDAFPAVAAGPEPPTAPASPAPTRITVTPGPAPQSGQGDADPWAAFPATADVGWARALFEGLLGGATANFRDELYGVARASGMPEPVGGLRIPVGAARLAYEALAGRGAATAAYEEGRDRIRGVQKAAEKQYPGTTLAGEIAGAVALPVGGALGAATLPARIGRSAVVGAGYGAAAGAGEGEDATDRVARSLTGAVLGAATGGVIPVAAEGVRQAGRFINGMLPVAGMVRGVANPDAQAARNIAAELARSRAAGQAGLTEAEVVQGAAAGGPQRVMDMLGEPGRSLIRSAANLSPEGRAKLTEATKDRFLGQQERAQAVTERVVGKVPDSELEREALKSTARAQNRGAYRKAYAEGSGGLWSPELERLASSPAVGDAMRAASVKGKDIAVTEGFGGFNPRVRFTPDGRMEIGRGPTGAPTYPDLQFWDYTRRQISDAAKAAFRSGRDSEGATLSQLAEKMNAELDKLVPSYRAARRGAAAAFDAEDALDAGKKFLSSGIEIPAAQRAVAAFNPAELRLFRAGVAADITKRIGESGQNRSILNHRIFSSPNAVKQLRIAFGEQGAKEFEAFLRVESVMDIARQALGNSTTAQQFREMAMAGVGRASAGGLGGASVGGILTGDFSPSNLMTWALMAGGGRAALDARVAKRVADMLVSKDPAVIQKGLSAVANTRSIMNALRAFDARLATVGSEQAPRGAVTSAVGGVSGGRAENENPP
ncbi:hypothetical protein [Rhodoplanes serenus]|uniref:hypothetical protein n=1 Tax=Rhodoplanes serenus TaxID=200615 RepID=UPI000DABDBED|nr:hypothetical protein [Rhodoplanes serenus]RAI31494.1 hypothetical protein CH340_18510 [Rhodoplanes serenus]